MKLFLMSIAACAALAGCVGYVAPYGGYGYSGDYRGYGGDHRGMRDRDHEGDRNWRDGDRDGDGRRDRAEEHWNNRGRD